MAETSADNLRRQIMVQIGRALEAFSEEDYGEVATHLSDANTAALELNVRKMRSERESRQ